MRADGKRVKNADPMYQVAAFIMNKRVDAMNMITLDIPLEPIKEYILDAKKRGHSVSHLGVVIAAYLRTVAEFPGLNRFVVNKRIYARNYFEVGMVVLRGGRMDDHGSMSKVRFNLDDDIFTVEEKIDSYIEANRGESQKDNGTEKMVRFFLSVPGLVNVGIAFVRFLDRHGWMPKKLIEVSPFHVSLAISNLASIRTNHIYHHCYEFGTTSVFLTMGNSRLVPKLRGGEMTFEKCMPMGVVMDERIASGSYFALAFRKMRTYFADPALLEQKAAIVNHDEV